MAMILVADDEEMILHLVSGILKSAGHDTVEAHNGLEAVSLFRSYPKRFDLVITDLKMPTMDGFQAVKLIRETRPAMKIICMSGYSEAFPSDVVCLAKPFLPRNLIEAVEKTLAVQRPDG